ncbi:iron-containing alcohol dehydrogenase [Thiobacillus denitrificans ATCC 25259]|uniref:Iron-containing alcohol dehydrogenase n=1 Tax=Thiobacillus denitrificans (strain ATCC 25259 / T1) TaxID=292415 RepID=Q3SI13_THIDA|nr:iron-containing alcohol dehydrogenase [Thiobacillus denitrificans]AAZ97720.1 iron-containing alcohol dehydrogenase [Thiobacillus denitrificans ATCC 25259]
MHVTSFSLSRLPRIEFGAGSIGRLPAMVRQYGTRALLVTGGASFERTAAWPALLAGLRAHGVEWSRIRVAGEPSPDLIDRAVRDLQSENVEVVIGIGGGSALDAAKAIAGLLRTGNSVMDHLEGVGPELPYTGPAVPFIAVPTTAGTGSEATKNAVLSVQGTHGFKKSFRDEKLVAEFAVVDPDLLATCPPAVVAANGMDAFTQLLESFISSRAAPFTDSIAWGGMKAARDGLLALHADQGDAAARERMAYAALASGITLAQAGLGSVHGLAAPLGAFFPIPHGLACGTLLAEATEMNLGALRARAPSHPALGKYAQVGRLLGKDGRLADADAQNRLVSILRAWTETLGLPTLGHYGVTASDIPRIVANSRGSSMRTNPVVLDDGEIAGILEARI